MAQGRATRAGVVVTLECPDGMRESLAKVLAGEYESGYSGHGLTVLDIGAHVGAFTVWAHMRWPGSTIHAYEPTPGTFQMLARNVAGLPNVILHEEAVYPGADGRQAFHARYPGDSQAAMLAHAPRTFAVVDAADTFPVAVVSPGRLPSCDVVKLDVEGAEGDILDGMDLAGVSLIVLEYHSDANKDRIRRRLDADFVCEHEDSTPWSVHFNDPRIRKELAGDHYGHLFFSSRRANKLRKVDLSEMHAAARIPLRKLLAAVPGALRIAVENRLRRLRP